jgi:4-hydroxy-tetrahydrodipicolinate synthase
MDGARAAVERDRDRSVKQLRSRARREKSGRVAPSLHGVFGALPTPFGADGRPDGKRLDPIVDFLIAAGLDGLCVGGATGEYAACSAEDRARLFRRVARRTKQRVPIIYGVGAGTSSQAAYLAEVAAECGGAAVLVPPPFYFLYEPVDLVDILRELSEHLPLPALLYYIPQFTSRFDLRAALRLIETTPNIVGIKDSSGSRKNLPLLARAKARFSMVYFSGDDALLFEAEQNGADGAISGVAAACPELLVAIQKAHRAGRTGRARALQALLDKFIAQASVFPAPWGIKLAVEARGFAVGPLSWPVGARMQSRKAKFREWFAPWLVRCLEACSADVSG